MPRVFTILCHGTKFDRHKQDELVADFGRNLVGTEVRVGGFTNNPNHHLSGDFLILEGPGSSSGQADAPMPGSVNPYTLQPKTPPQNDVIDYGVGVAVIPRPRSFADHAYGDGLATASTVEGQVFGTGWDDNVQRAVGIVANLQPQPDRINLLGWSRGAVTTLKIANKLNEVFGNSIRVNIFAIDPVYGGLGVPTGSDVTTIPSNVTSAIIILSMHERRNTFQPQDLSRVRVQDPMATTAIFLPMPGGHADQVFSPSTLPVERKHAAKVTWHLAWRFLSHCGTGIDRSFARPMDVLELSDAYARMRIHMSNYAANGTTGLTNVVMGIGTSDRSMLASLGTYVAHQHYFVNEHHRAVFRQAFPLLYQTVFTQTQSGIGSLVSLQNAFGALTPDHRKVALSLLPFVAARALALRRDPLWLLRGVSFGLAPNLMSLSRSWPASLPLT